MLEESIKNALQLNLQEYDDPFFTDEQLELLYLQSENSIAKASWRGCLLKAKTDDEVRVGPIELKSSGKDYWLNLAELYKEDYLIEKEEKDKLNKKSYYRTMALRVDE